MSTRGRTGYTVIGVWYRGGACVAGVVKGNRALVDVTDGSEYPQRWATYVLAQDPEDAEDRAVLKMEGEDDE